MEAATGTETQEIECPYCAEKISNRAKKCRHCGEILDVVMRELEMVRSKTGHAKGWADYYFLGSG